MQHTECTIQNAECTIQYSKFFEIAVYIIVVNTVKPPLAILLLHNSVGVIIF